MIISRALAWACLTFLFWAMLFVAGLLIVLVVVQHLRGDATAQPVTHLVGAVIATGFGILCRVLARRLI